MSPKIVVRSLVLLLAAFCFYSASAVAQSTQDDSSSVADAARRARQQKQEATKPAKVIDNDSIPSAPSSTAAAAPAVVNAPAAAEAAKSEASDAPANKDAVDALKKEIAEKKEKVDFQKRELTLEQDNYYSNPDHERDTAGKQKLEDLQAEFTQAQSELAVLEAKLATMAPASDEKPGLSEKSEAPETAKP